MIDKNETQNTILRGLALLNALTAQLEFAKRLTRAIVQSGLLPACVAQDVLLGTAIAVEKRAGKRSEPGKSSHQDYVAEQLRNHAQGLRGLAAGFAPKVKRAS